MTQVIRDKKNNRLGEVRTKTDGSQELYNVSNIRMGRYDAKQNKTFNRTGVFVGRGNILLMLL